MASESKKRADERYKRKYQRRFVISVNRRTEPDMLAYLEQVGNIQGYIKDLVKRDMAYLASGEPTA